MGRTVVRAVVAALVSALLFQAGAVPPVVLAVAQPAIAYPAGGGTTSSRTLTWTDDGSDTQTKYSVEVSTASNFSSILASSGQLTSANHYWMIPTSTSLTDGTTYWWRVQTQYTGNANWSSWVSTSLVAGPVNLGVPQQDTFESWGFGNGDSLSVNVSTGNAVVTSPLVSLPIRGGALSVVMTYNSQSAANVGMGPGWRLNALRRLTELGNGDVVFTAGDGSVHTFVKGTPSGSVTPYARPSTIYATLTKDTNNSVEWTLKYRDQTYDTFDQSGSEGLLATQVDRSGNAVTFSYYSSSNRLYRATDPNSRYLEFEWDTGASPVRITKMTDWAWISGGVIQSSQTGARRQYRFFYDGSGYMSGWASPKNTAGSSCPSIQYYTCLTYSSGLLTRLQKRQYQAVISGNSITTGSGRDVSTEITYRGNEVSQVRDAEQYNANATGSTFDRLAGSKMKVVRQGTPTSTTPYGYVAATDTLGRVQSVWRTLGSTDIEQRTTWASGQPIEPASIVDNYGAALSTPSHQIYWDYSSGSMGIAWRMSEQLTATDYRTTDYDYNSFNDATEIRVALNGSTTDKTVTRYCYGAGGCTRTDTGATVRAVIENYKDGTKGGSTGNSEDVSTEYLYDSYGQRTRETRYNYDAAGSLLDSRAIGYTWGSNGNQTSVIVNR